MKKLIGFLASFCVFLLSSTIQSDAHALPETDSYSPTVNLGGLELGGLVLAQNSPTPTANFTPSNASYTILKAYFSEIEEKEDADDYESSFPAQSFVRISFQIKKGLSKVGPFLYFSSYKSLYLRFRVFRI